MSTISLTTLYIFTMSVFFALTMIKMLSHSKIHISKKYITSLFFIWISFDFMFLGINNSLIPEEISGLGLFIVILIAIVISGLLLLPLFKALLSLPQQFLLLPQAYRVFFGLGFLIEGAYDIIPLDFGVIDSIFHITSAFLATTLAVYIADGCKCSRSIVLVNIFGLLDIVIVAVGISFFILNDLSVTHNLFNVVFFAAPIFIWLHLISIYKVYKDRIYKNE